MPHTLAWLIDAAGTCARVRACMKLIIAFIMQCAIEDTLSIDKRDLHRWFHIIAGLFFQTGFIEARGQEVWLS